MEQTFHTAVVAGMLMFVIGFAACRQHETKDEDSFSRDHAEISKILDAALLSQTPIDSFRTLVGRVRAYPSVDSAWVDGVTCYVKYKHGGTVVWTLPPQPTK